LPSSGNPESASTVTATADALLFDLDGTLVDTTVAFESVWRWAAHELDVPFSQIEPYIHGIPADQALGRAVPRLDEDTRSRLAAEILVRQADPASPVSALPGALDLLSELPPDRWAIVTSGDVSLARSSMEKAGLPEPAVLVTADDVDDGKPHPAPFELAMQRLGTAAAGCIAVEDSPAGISSAVAAGVRVIGVGATFSHDLLVGATWLIPGLTSLTASWEGDRIVVSLSGFRSV
jgi:sugar-phosphatase